MHGKQAAKQMPSSTIVCDQSNPRQTEVHQLALPLLLPHFDPAKKKQVRNRVICNQYPFILLGLHLLGNWYVSGARSMYNEYPCFSMEDTQWRYSEFFFFSGCIGGI